MLFNRRVRVRVVIRCSVWLVIGYAHVFILLFVVVVTLPALCMIITRLRVTVSPL